jgi:hypothetical protein
MIIIVSGLPRSGTSMMMKMLAEGGVPVLVDADNPSTELNPGGAYAYEPTKTIVNDASWMDEAEGKAVKVTAHFLRHLPKGHDYKILFMERDIDETLQSERLMVAGRNMNPDIIGDARMLEQTREGVKAWLARQDDMRVLLVDYNRLLESSYHSEIADFIGMPMDMAKVASVPDKQYYRNRGA